MERRFFTVFIRLEDGSAKAIKRKAYTVDEAVEKVIDEGFLYARYETLEYYNKLRAVQ